MYHSPLLHVCHVLGLAFHTNPINDTKKDKTGACLLQLMKVETTNNGSVNVLWDVGATLSIITFKKQMS